MITMAKNPNGLTSKSPKEWGKTARKHEDHYRGFRARGKADAIKDGLEG